MLPAAANQVIFGAKPLWNLGCEPGTTPRPKPFNDWIAWRSKFGELSTSAELSEETRALLKRAVEVMDAVAQGPAWSCT